VKAGGAGGYGDSNEGRYGKSYGGRATAEFGQTEGRDGDRTDGKYWSVRIQCNNFYFTLFTAIIAVSDILYFCFCSQKKETPEVSWSNIYFLLFNYLLLLLLFEKFP
jgi:hypothetical protein